MTPERYPPFGASDWRVTGAPATAQTWAIWARPQSLRPTPAR